MHAAQQSKNPDVVQALIDAGANGKPKSRENRTAFDYAQGNSHIRNTEVYWWLNEARF